MMLKNIVLVGGGSSLFKKAIKQAFPRQRIQEVRDPLYANVRGFQLAGANYMRSIGAAVIGERGVS